MQPRLDCAFTRVMEALVLFLAMVSAWPFGSVHAIVQSLLLAGVAILLGCWAARIILAGRPIWTPCPIAPCLAGVCLLALVQTLPLGESWVQWLAPETAALRQGVLAPDESLAQGPREPAEDRSIAGTLSLAPGATRRYLIQLIGVLAVFCVVRNNLREPGSFRRLAWFGAANGVLLTVVGLGQLASSPPETVFWSIPTQGSVFGPFICRNHAAFYLNLCLGLTTGLFLGTRCFIPMASGAAASCAASHGDLFRDPRVMWLASTLGILVTGLLFSLSRGGVLGLVIGGLVGLLVLRSRVAARWWAGGSVLAVTVMLTLWLGHERVSQRWENLWQDNAQGEARATVWARAFPLVGRFPLWGSGLGTFGLVEQTTRQPGDPSDIFHEHAHSDYLELWIEGGTSQLLLGGLVIGLVFAKGVQAVRRHEGTPNAGLACGGIIAFTAIVVHSFVDFGLHIAAVGLLAAVLAAMLANLAESGGPEELDARPAAPGAVRWSGALLQAGALLAVAALPHQFRRARKRRRSRFRLAELAARRKTGVSIFCGQPLPMPPTAPIFISLADSLISRWGRIHEGRQLLAATVLVATAPSLNLAALGLIG